MMQVSPSGFVDNVKPIDMLSLMGIVRACNLAVASVAHLRARHPFSHQDPRVSIAYVLGGTCGRIDDHLVARGCPGEVRRNWTLLFRARGARPGCNNSIERIVRMAVRAGLSIDTIPGPEKDSHMPHITVDSCVIDMHCADVTDAKVEHVMTDMIKCPQASRDSMGLAPKWF
jgi:hypothetical protein